MTLRWSASAFLVYGTICAFTGDWFPFTQVPMYAELARGGRTEAAVPVVLVDGERVDIRSFTGFRGPDPADIEPFHRCRADGVCRSYPSSDPEDVKIAAWVREHKVPDDAAPGPVALDVAFVMLRARPEGGYDEHLEVVWRGSAWPRP